MYKITLRSVRVIVAVEKRYHKLECVFFLALGTQHAMRVRHIVICGLSCSKIFYHII
jgi:hypothetical protein